MKKLIALLIATIIALFALTEYQESDNIKYTNRDYTNTVEINN